MQLIIAGRGGQGILLMTKVMGEAAFLSGLPVLSSETHGMALRGGSVITHLKVGPYRSPLIPRESADVVIGMDEDEANNNIHFLKEGGLLIINHAGNGNGSLSVDANELARELGHIKWSNMVLLGFVVSRVGHPFSRPAVREAIARVSPGPFLNHNLKAFELGYERGSIQKKKRPEKGEEVS
jgi:indolepyruvate ferredoxin oxidoreductase, beta subunit